MENGRQIEHYTIMKVQPIQLLRGTIVETVKSQNEAPS
jgi:hypothetical protein